MRILGFILMVVSWLCASTFSSLPAEGNQQLSLFRSTESNRRSLKIVVFNSNLALVNEQRAVPKAEGVYLLNFSGVGEKIIPSSVIIDGGSEVEVLEQQYNYDLLTKEKLLTSYLGKEVLLEREDKRTGSTQQVRGMLLSLEGGTVIQFDDHVEVDPKGTLIVPEVPENLVIKPEFNWLMKAGSKGECLLDVSYLTQGLDWSCDYVLALEDNSDKADLSCWVSIRNNSGTSYGNAELSLVAGSLNRVQDQRVAESMARIRSMPAPKMAAFGEDAGNFVSEEAFEYYRYNLGRMTSLPRDQMKQIELFSGRELKVSRIYRFEGGGGFHYGPVANPSHPAHADVYLEWKNSGKNYPEMPLPGGVVRLYSRKGSRLEGFLGEDRISHTPEGEKITLRAGKAFDLLCLKKQTDYKRLSDRLRQVSIEIELTNRKKTDVVVQVDEMLPGDWKIISHSLEFEKLAADRVRFSPRVPAKEKVIVKYTVQIL